MVHNCAIFLLYIQFRRICNPLELMIYVRFDSVERKAFVSLIQTAPLPTHKPKLQAQSVS